MPAQSATNSPLYQPAAALEPANSSISDGSTGMMMPIATMSSIAVTKMKASAAWRADPERMLIGELRRRAALIPGAGVKRYPQGGRAAGLLANRPGLTSTAQKKHRLLAEEIPEPPGHRQADPLSGAVK